jgi:glycosyltransferase involved in cell wall biosynthesis
MNETPGETLNILHVFRAPVGGLFRHVLDLARGQVARGHRVGLIVDSTTGGARAAAALIDLAPGLALGISYIPIPQHVGLADVSGVRHASRRIAETGAHVIHGHGAKGGAYARLAAAPLGMIRAYTPHGGSLHYRSNTPVGLLYLTLERLLMRRGDVFLFESKYSSDAFHAKIGFPQGIARVVHNGIGEADFERVAPGEDATDLLFVGELRSIKGVDLLIAAMASLHHAGRRVSATIVGDGSEAAALRAQATRLGLAGQIRFLPAMPARRAFSQGRLLLVPSRAESLPYIVLEAAGAGIPVIATRVGGMAEIFGPQSGSLVDPENPEALAAAIASALDDPQAMQAAAQTLRDRVRAGFSVDGMVTGVLASYRTALRPL